MEATVFDNLKALGAWRRETLESLDPHAEYLVRAGNGDFTDEQNGVTFYRGKATLLGLPADADEEEVAERMDQLRWFLNCEPRRRQRQPNEWTDELKEAAEAGDRTAPWVWVVAYRLDKAGDVAPKKPAAKGKAAAPEKAAATEQTAA